MTLTFEANSVHCDEALGGEILQVNFDTLPASQGEDGRSTPYVLLSRNFEFPDSPAIEWHDGDDYDGGAEIVAITLDRTRISIRLDSGLAIDVAFHLTDKKLTQLTSFLTRMIDDDHICFVNLLTVPTISTK